MSNSKTKSQQLSCLEFATNMFGSINPNHKNWEDAHCIIISDTAGGKQEPLWTAIFTVQPFFCRSKKLDAPWEEIPTSEEIIEAIKNVVYVKQDFNNN